MKRRHLLAVGAGALAYSRLTDVADAYSFEPLDLDDLVGASVAHFNPVFKQDCTISVDIPADLIARGRSVCIHPQHIAAIVDAQQNGCIL